MSALRISLLSLIFAALAASPAAGALTPVAPSDGTMIDAGQPVTFRVQSEASDSVFVAVSKSSAIVDSSCGKIDDDAELETLSPTADPIVYEGTPQVFKLYDFWLNRAGTYYWQAYSYTGGCHTSAVRTLVVTGVRSVEIAPRPLEPGEGATVPTGPFSFSVSVVPADPPNYLWLHVSRSSQRTLSGGLIGDDVAIVELAPTADRTIWTATPQYQPGPSFWMNTPGTYYWQPHRISSFGDPDGFVEGPVRSLTLQGAPPPPPSEPVTIRGDEAFTTGTPNDLYLACTKLDLWLVDVLPAGAQQVSIMGAADLRLKGQTVDILLDGRRVGSAPIRSDGSFAATVRAPSKARRAHARYQARVGATVSQNLRLERRMVNAGLRQSGGRITLSGRITKPLAKRPDRIRIQRYRSCGVKDSVAVKTVRPDRAGRFKVTFARPAASVKALLFRATTKVAGSRDGKAKLPTFTLPRAINAG